MLRLMLLLISLSCISLSTAFFYPICSQTNNKPCISFSRIPPIFRKVQTGDGSDDSDDTPISELLFEVTDSFFTTLFDSFDLILIPTIYHIWEATKWCALVVTANYHRVLKYMPYYDVFFKEPEKVKADSKLYILFITSGLAIYLILYVYFTRKLYHLYQSNLRAQYLSSVQKVLQVKH